VSYFALGDVGLGRRCGLPGLTAVLLAALYRHALNKSYCQEQPF
jgi:hypothetical protein